MTMNGGSTVSGRDIMIIRGGCGVLAIITIPAIIAIMGVYQQEAIHKFIIKQQLNKNPD